MNGHKPPSPRRSASILHQPKKSLSATEEPAISYIVWHSGATLCVRSCMLIKGPPFLFSLLAVPGECICMTPQSLMHALKPTSNSAVSEQKTAALILACFESHPPFIDPYGKTVIMSAHVGDQKGGNRRRGSLRCMRLISATN